MGEEGKIDLLKRIPFLQDKIAFLHSNTYITVIKASKAHLLLITYMLVCQHITAKCSLLTSYDKVHVLERNEFISLNICLGILLKER